MNHHSLYGSGPHINDPVIQKLRLDLTPVMDEFDIDLVLAGHDHIFLRTYPMLGGKPQIPQNPAPDGVTVDPAGTIYMTLNSASGSKFYALSSEAEYYAAARSQLWVPAVTHISVTEDRLEIDTFRTDTMENTDHFAIHKTNNRPKPSPNPTTTLQPVTNATADSNPSEQKDTGSPNILILMIISNLLPAGFLVWLVMKKRFKSIKGG